MKLTMEKVLSFSMLFTNMIMGISTSFRNFDNFETKTIFETNCV
jgi:hypothetical protein